MDTKESGKVLTDSTVYITANKCIDTSPPRRLIRPMGQPVLCFYAHWNQLHPNDLPTYP